MMKNNMKDNNPIRFGGVCEKCGATKISCVCIQKINTTKEPTEAEIQKSLKKFLKKKLAQQKTARQIDADLLIEEIQEAKLALIRAMNHIGASDGIKHILPQHYDKITKMVEEMALKK